MYARSAAIVCAPPRHNRRARVPLLPVLKSGKTQRWFVSGRQFEALRLEMRCSRWRSCGGQDIPRNVAPPCRRTLGAAPAEQLRGSLICPPGSSVALCVTEALWVQFQKGRWSLWLEGPLETYPSLTLHLHMPEKEGALYCVFRAPNRRRALPCYSKQMMIHFRKLTSTRRIIRCRLTGGQIVNFTARRVNPEHETANTCRVCVHLGGRRFATGPRVNQGGSDCHVCLPAGVDRRVVQR
jgi:hypothetical protein